jgi:uncharacterized protein (TIGR02996 family)
MSASDSLAATILEGEREWITSVVEDLLDDDRKLVYADWLEDRGNGRSAFLRKYVAALRSMDPKDFPADKGLSEEWLELIGYRLGKAIAEAGVPELKGPAFRLARPALRMEPVAEAAKKIPIGASKIGGSPDLPADVAWPTGDDCKAIYNSDTARIDRLAGFLAQVNLAEIAHTQAAKDLPKTGVLSFFCFQDVENDEPDVIGARALLLPGASQLIRKHAPKDLSQGNEAIPTERLYFDETLDLPNAYDGPWSNELKPYHDSDVLEHFRRLNFDNVLGYARSTTGGDPTLDRQMRHLILLENSVGCRLHIQIHEDDLAARNFDAIRLAWVDFD